MGTLSHLANYFTDPVLRAPTIASMLMCLSAALIGTIVFLRKESLVGEVLSHATYPGIALGGIVAAALTFAAPAQLALGILTGALIFSLLGMAALQVLQRKYRIASDSAMTFTLAAFFGVGVTIASRMQFTHSGIYRQVQVYLYGQAATMTDIHIALYGGLALLIVCLLLLFYKELKAVTMDREFAYCIGLPTKLIDAVVILMVALAVVVGIRSVGVVLMSGMLIAPAVAARQMTNRMSRMLFWAALIGLLSGFLGNFLSLELGQEVALPTGPMIVLVASVFALAALLFAPERGVLILWLRARAFRRRCLGENVLKTLWRSGKLDARRLARLHRGAEGALKRLKSEGFVEREGGDWKLTLDGEKRAAHIVRLHRLWEVYLVDYLGFGAERVHYSAEEMEHILTPELERELILLTGDAKKDPHHQPIPEERL